MPVHVVEKLNKIVRSERKLRAELGREPSSAEIGRDLELTPDEVEQIRRSSQTPVSLDKPVSDEDDSQLGHLIRDDSGPAPDEAVETALQNEALRRVVATLPSRQRTIIELRFGFDGHEPRTLDEVGETFNVTRERIRQIEQQTLKNLRVLATPALLDEAL